MSPIAAVITGPVIIAALGGLTIGVLNLLELRNVPRERRPDLTDPFYWFAFVAWPVLGGLVAYMYGEELPRMNRLLSYQIGLSAPVIVRALASTIPSPLQRKPLPEGA